MANPIITTLNKIGDTVQDILSGPSQPVPAPTARTSTGQTCLEYTGMRLRRDHLRQNMWRRNDIEYSRPLVLAEYDIQTEFKISSTAEQVAEAELLAEQRSQEKEAKAAAKKEAKRKKKEEKEKKKQSQVKGVVNNKNEKNSKNQPGGVKNETEPVETTVPASKQRDGLTNTVVKWTNYVVSQLPEKSDGLHNWSNDVLGE